MAILDPRKRKFSATFLQKHYIQPKEGNSLTEAAN
ncbi:hypothetical protein CCACVL1_03893 [Corchorus capsularis]|uniref:Uncharacterized protein n=1 Tax=Corchorus capsularis TaxID=210143 RepID=A0A1R3JWG4_COCAP|nr:hypothetical protein CCACVL1_03893 [Corchorus capsularis]